MQIYPSIHRIFSFTLLLLLSFQLYSQRILRESRMPGIKHVERAYMPDQYLFGSSAIPMEKGEVRYRNNGITLNSLNMGITKNLSLDVGFELFLSSFLILLDEGGLISYANLKYGYSLSENFHVGGGLFLGGMLSMDSYNRDGFLAPYGMATFGNSTNNISLAVGSPIQGEHHPTFLMLSMKMEVGRNLDLISENYYLHHSYENNARRINGRLPPVGSDLDRYFVFSLALRFYTWKSTLDIGLSSFLNSYTYTLVDRSSGQGNLVRSRNKYWFPLPIPILAASIPLN